MRGFNLAPLGRGVGEADGEGQSAEQALSGPSDHLSRKRARLNLLAGIVLMPDQVTGLKLTLQPIQSISKKPFNRFEPETALAPPVRLWHSQIQSAAEPLTGISRTRQQESFMSQPASAEEPKSVLDRVLAMELARVTERAAVAAARLRGRGDEMAADQAAVDAMRTELNNLHINGTIVIGEGERDEAPMLYIGEKVGSARGGTELDIALDPLEGTTICAKNLPNSLAVVAIAEKGNLLYAPDVYMDKIAIGPGYPDDLIHLDASPEDNIHAVARAKGVDVSQITACIMDRPRHAKLIEAVRSTGAAIRLIGDGDVAGVIHTTAPEETGIDIYIGIGGAPEGVLAAAALRCTGGQMQGRLLLDTPEKVARAARMGISDPKRLYNLTDMAKGDVVFSATGVTDGNMLHGVRFMKGYIETHTIVMRAHSLTIREIRAKHRDLVKF